MRRTLLYPALVIAALLGFVLAADVLATDVLATDVLATDVFATDVLATEEIKPKRHRKSWCAVTAPVRHLSLRDGRAFFRGPANLNDHYPYFLAASAAERDAGFGYQLRLSNAHRLFAPVETEAAAGELARVFTGGMLVPDEATYQLLRAEALRLKPTCPGWGVEVKDGRPGCFGITVTRDHVDLSGMPGKAPVFKVRALVFKCSSYHRLEVVEQTWTIPDTGEPRLRTKSWITGPPQAWQTAGDVDQAEERRLYGEVTRFRAAFLKVLGADRTLAAVKRAVEGGATFAVIRARLGEPDVELGGDRKEESFAYRLRDGTAVVFTVERVGGEDRAPRAARHVASLSVGEDGKAAVGKTLKALE